MEKDHRWETQTESLWTIYTTCIAHLLYIYKDIWANDTLEIIPAMLIVSQTVHYIHPIPLQLFHAPQRIHINSEPFQSLNFSCTFNRWAGCLFFLLLEIRKLHAFTTATEVAARIIRIISVVYFFIMTIVRMKFSIQIFTRALLLLLQQYTDGGEWSATNSNFELDSNFTD